MSDDGLGKEHLEAGILGVWRWAQDVEFGSSSTELQTLRSRVT